MARRPAEESAYPFELALLDAPEAGPPGPVPAELVAAWREHEELERAAAEQLVGAAAARRAPALEVLLAEANAANPRRDKRSDGWIGDARHAKRRSGHNPDARAVVVAQDLDVDGLDLVAAFERARQLCHAGQLPQLEGGHLILNAKITRPDFSGWADYDGDNPHVTHGHAEVAHDPGRADDRRAWGIFTADAPPFA